MSWYKDMAASMVEGIEPYRKLSPFYYYISAEPLRNGLNLWGMRRY